MAEFWVHHSEERGILDGRGVPSIHVRPDGGFSSTSVQITVWTSREAVLAFCQRKKMLITRDEEDLVQAEFPGEPPSRWTRVQLNWS